MEHPALILAKVDGELLARLHYYYRLFSHADALAGIGDIYRVDSSGFCPDATEPMGMPILIAGIRYSTIIKMDSLFRRNNLWVEG